MSALGRLSILLGLDAAEFTSGLTNAERQAGLSSKRIQDSIAKGVIQAELVINALPAAVSRAFSAINAATVRIDGLNDLKDITGDSIESLSALQNAVQGQGNSFESFSSGLEKLTRNLSASDDEAKGAGKALEALGIQSRDALGSIRPAGQIAFDVASALASYADGAGKAAIVTALFGKEGIKLLPTLKDLSETGLQQATVTDQQAAAAEAFVKAQAAMQAQIERTMEAIATGAVPAITSLKGAFSETIQQLFGLRDESGKLLKGDELRSWAESAGRAIAYVADIGLYVARVIKNVGLQIGATAAQGAAILRGDFGQVGQIGKSLQGDIDTNLAGSTFSDIYARKIGALKFDAAFAAQNRGAADSRPQLNFKLAPDKKTGSNTELDKSKKELDEINKLLDSLKAKSSGYDSNFYKQFDLLNDALDKNIIDITELNRLQNVLLQQQPYMEKAKKAEADAARQNNEEFDKAYEKRTEEESVITRRLETSRKMAEAIAFENSLVGKSAVEKEKAIKLEELRTAGIVKGTEAYDLFANQILRGIENSDALAKTTETVNDLSTAITQDLVGGGGKAIESLIDKWIAEFLRLQVIKPLLDSIFTFGGGGGGGGGGFDFLGTALSLFGGFKATGGPVSAGKSYVVGERGPELFMPRGAGTIVPNSALGQAAAPSINIYNSIGSVASQDDVVRGMTATRNQIRAEFMRNSRFGGVMA